MPTFKAKSEQGIDDEVVGVRYKVSLGWEEGQNRHVHSFTLLEQSFIQRFGRPLGVKHCRSVALEEQTL